MSYTKMCKEITRYLKQNGMITTGTAYDSEELTQKRLEHWQIGFDEIYQKWIDEKRYKELVSVAHAGWHFGFDYRLAEHFVCVRELEWLRFLLEKHIKYYTDNLIWLIKYEGDVELLTLINEEQFVKSRTKVCYRIDKYLVFLKELDVPEDYINSLEILRKKVDDITVKKSDLKFLNQKKIG